MRRFAALSLLLLGAAEGASAADLDPDYLRGGVYEEAVPAYDWTGFYAGAHVSYSDAKLDFSELQGGTVVRFVDRDVRGTGFGGFVGYNGQWDDAVVGIEANYTHTDLDVASLSPDTIVDQGTVYSSPTAHLRIKDLGVLRLRGGWALGRFMPYGTIGLAVGRADLSYSALVNSNVVAAPLASKDDDFAFGYAVGVGIDVAVLPNVFVRGEYEYVSLDSFSGVTGNLHTVRGALGVKFW